MRATTEIRAAREEGVEVVAQYRHAVDRWVPTSTSIAPSANSNSVTAPWPTSMKCTRIVERGAGGTCETGDGAWFGVAQPARARRMRARHMPGGLQDEAECTRAHNIL